MRKKNQVEAKERNWRDWGIIQKKGKDDKPIWYARIIRNDENGKKKQYTQKADNKTHAKHLRDKLAEKYTNFGERIMSGERMSFRELAENYKKRKLIPAKYHNNRKVAGLRSVEKTLSFYNTLLKHFSAKKSEVSRLPILKVSNKKGWMNRL